MEAKQTDLARLLMGTKTFIIPQFQRHYKWKKPQWAELFDDVLDQYNDPDVKEGRLRNNEGHFLGSLVLHPTPGPASTVAEYWVIDGQQRLITLGALIAALRDFRATQDPTWQAAEYDDQYLRNKYSKDRPHRVMPGDNDRDDFISTIYQGEPQGLVGDAYRYFHKRIGTLGHGGTLDFQTMERAILLRMLIVEINTSSDDNINQIFHTINHAGMKLSAIDLIRNHAFMQIPPAEAEAAYRELWKPLELSFDTERNLAEYVWAQLVRRNARAAQKDLYQPFAELVSQEANGNFDRSAADATKHVLMQLRDEASLYLSLIDPTTHPDKSWSRDLKQVIQDLATWNSTPSRPLTLEVLSRRRAGGVTDDDAAEALRHLLSLLVRRALCGVGTNNLNRQLSPIPSQLGDGPLARQFSNALSGESKYWPSDADVLQQTRATGIYVKADKRQVKYILEAINRSLNPTESVAGGDLTIEHIMPQELSPEWVDYFAENGISLDEAKSRRHALGNLTLTGHNAKLARQLVGKKAVMFGESNLPLNRSLSSQASWLPRDIDERSDELAREALKVWPRKVDGGISRPAPDEGETAEESEVPGELFSVESAISSISADSWTSVEALAELCQVSSGVVEAELERLEYPVFSSGSSRVVPGDKEAEEWPLGTQLMDARDLSTAVQAVGAI